jgi:2,3-bisphosphoglycerate-independent phosphoglycerate mutase
MKLAVVILAGAADRPSGVDGDRTPLSTARLRALDELVAAGRVGGVRTVPDGLPTTHEHALVSLFGQNPEDSPVSAGAMLALAIKAPLEPDEIAFRCDLVNLYGGTVVDPGAGRIGGQEAEILLQALKDALDTEETRFLPGRRWRNLLLVRAGQVRDVRTHSPATFMGEPIKANQPRGPGAEVIRRLMEQAGRVLEEHEINQVRVDLGENPANGIWIWGGGRPAALPFAPTGKTAAVGRHPSFIGLATAAGIGVREVDEEAGLSTVKDKALTALRSQDLVIVHLDGGLAASRQGDRAGTARFRADADREILAPLAKRLVASGKGRLLVVASHVSDSDSRRDVEGLVPFVLAGAGTARYGQTAFSEEGAENAELRVEHGHELLEYALRD